MPSLGEDDSQPQPSSCKTLLDGCGAVNHASVPKKLRSAIKKRGRESITFPIPKKKHHIKKSKLNTVTQNQSYIISFTVFLMDGKWSLLLQRKGHITKDEEEVAETLYALASMFTDAKHVHRPKLDHQQPEMKPSAVLEEGDSINEAKGEESVKTGSKMMIKAAAAASHSSTADVKSQSLGAQQPKVEPTTPSTAAGFRSDLCRVPALGEREINLEQVGVLDITQGGVSGVQYGTDDKCKGAPGSETQKSCSRFPAWFESTILSSQSRVTENSISTEKVQDAPVSAESKNSWKRCTAHVYISSLIKVLQISQRKESLPEKPTQRTACCGADLQLCGSQIAGRKNGPSSSGIQKGSTEIQNDSIAHKRPVQDQQQLQLQLATETSALCSFKQGYDFLCLGAGERGGHRHSDEARIQYHAPYLQSQDHSAMLFPLPQNGHFTTQNSALQSQQQQVSRHHHSSFPARTGQEQQLLQTNYINRSGEREEPSAAASVLNYAHALFPHLNAALAAKYQHQLLPLNNMLPLGLKRQQYHPPLGFERNLPHLQLHNLLNR